MNKQLSALLLPLVLLAGCSAESEDSGGGAATTSGTSVEAALQTVIDGVKNGEGEAVWNALPAKHQSDINGVVQRFAMTMDDGMWQQATGVLKTLQKILDEKSDFVAAHPQFASMPNAKETVPQIAGLLKTILDNAGDLEALKSFDGATFTKTAGGDLIKQLDALGKITPGPAGSLLESLDKMKFETIEEQEKAATVKMMTPQGDEAEQDFMKIDGKWMPLNVALAWDDKLKEINESLDKMPETLKKSRAEVMGVTMAMNGMLAPLQSAENQEQFDAALNGMMGNLMMMFGGGMPGGGPPPGSQAPPPAQGGSPGGGDMP